MAKFLLWSFAIMHFINNVATYLVEGSLSTNQESPMWIAIAVLALCEAIEKRNDK